MGFFENLRLSLSGIISNKMRSFLTMLGIIIGISAVITITTIGNSVSSTLSNTMNKLGGMNYLYLYLEARYPDNEEDWDTWEYPEITSDDTITDETIDQLSEYLGDEFKYATVENYIGSGTATNLNGENYANVTIEAVNDGFCQDMAGVVNLLKGRWITSRDCKEIRNVAIVSDIFISNYFNDDSINPIGQNIEVDMNGTICNFVIVGVYEYSNAYFGRPDTSTPEKERYTYIYTSSSYANRINLYDDESQVDGYQYLMITANDGVDMNLFQANVDAFFADYYADNPNWQTYTYNASSDMSTITTALTVVTLAITIIAGISLIVGGVGVMNIMLVSITERTKEIGVRKALGAKNTSIRGQFILEAIMICLIGGIIGILSGIINSLIIAQVAKYVLTNYYPDEMSLISLTVEPNLLAIIISVVFSMLTGIFFGYYPANKAAKMNPIDALRYE